MGDQPEIARNKKTLVITDSRMQPSGAHAVVGGGGADIPASAYS